MQAISQAVPDKVIAQGYDTTTAFCLSWLGPTGWSVYLEVYGGGYGAGIGNDGCDAVDNPLSNCSNTPVEAMDQDFTFFRVIDYALRDRIAAAPARGAAAPASAAATRSWPMARRSRIYSDRFTGQAAGIFGGGPGASGRCEVLRDGETHRAPQQGRFALRRGDIVTISLGGGGGYGAPAQRPAALIQRDLEDGIISPARAAAWAQ